MRKFLFIILVFLVSQRLLSQSIYNGELIYIAAGTILQTPDSIINNGTIINNGDIRIGGIWQNNADYQPGTGQLTLTSNLPQVINHNDQSFTRLSITGGGIKTFGANIHIENELVLNSGVLQSANNAYIVIEQGASVTGASENAYIEGMVYQAGTGRIEFPVGVDGTFLPVILEDIKGNAPVVGVTAMSPNSNLDVTGRLEAVSANQYWFVDVLSGSFDGSQVTLPIKNEMFLDSVGQAVVAAAPAIDQPYQSLGGSGHSGDITAGTVTSEVDLTDPFVTVGKIEPLAENKILVYNAVSPNNDGLNDVLKFVGIENFPANQVTIYTRWGDKVFEMSGYDNINNVFDGHANIGKSYELPEGTYYYVLEHGDGSKNISGFFVLKY